MLAGITISALVGCGGGGVSGVARVQMGGSIQVIPLPLIGVVTTVAGTESAIGSSDGTGAAARFLFPSGITKGGRDLYVAEPHISRSGVSTEITAQEGIY
jgi:hypothetical protein